MSELDELADKGRSRVAAEDAARRAERARRLARKAASQANKNQVLRRSLGGLPPWASMALMAAIPGWVLASFGVGVAAQGALGPPLSVAAPAVLLVAGLAALVAALLFGQELARRRQLRWLEALPWPMDLDRYFQMLGQKRDRTRVRLDVVFIDAVPAADHELLASAALGVAVVHEARFDDGRLSVASELFDTKVTPRASGDRIASEPYHSNARPHQWLREVSDTALRAIHDRHPIERVDIRFER